MICPKCQSESLSIIPAEVRFYRNTVRTMSHPPMTPSPDIRVCLDCGWSEFSIPRSWLSAGWLRSLRQEPALRREVSLTQSFAETLAAQPDRADAVLYCAGVQFEELKIA